MSETLLRLVEDLNAGRLRVVDLTLPLSHATPLIPLPPQWNNSPAFTLRELSRDDARGPAWYWNAFETGEHTGTHFDAPVHWVSGKDLPDSTVDRIPPRKFIGPACVIEVTKEVAANSGLHLPFPIISSCTAAESSASPAFAISISCRPPAPWSSPRRSKSSAAPAAPSASSPSPRSFLLRRPSPDPSFRTEQGDFFFPYAP